MVKGRKNRPRPSLTELCRRMRRGVPLAAATKKSSRPCAFVRSSLHAAPSVVQLARAAASRPSNQARPAAAPCTRPHLRSYIGKSKSNLKLKRWIAVTKCTSLKSQGKAAICSTDTHYITTVKKKVNSRVQSSTIQFYISTHLFPLV